MQNFRIFHLKTFIFLVVKFSVYLNRLVLVMFKDKDKYDKDLKCNVVRLSK